MSATATTPQTFNRYADEYIFRAGDRLTAIDGLTIAQRGYDLPGALIEAAPATDPEYGAQVFTVWGTRNMVEMRVQADAVITVYRDR